MLYSIRDHFRESRDYFKQYLELSLKLDDPSLVDFKKQCLQVIKKQFPIVKQNVECPHYGSDVLALTNAILQTQILGVNGCIVEAGCFKGGLTAKMSHIAHLFDRQYICYDSFQGMPPNNEQNEQSIFGRSMYDEYAEGEYHSTLSETKSNIEKYGKQEVVELRKGFFSESLRQHREKIAVLYIDVDLAKSTREVLTELYNFVERGGIIMSQDCHIPTVLDLFKSEDFWQADLGIRPPKINGLGQKRIGWWQK